MTSRPMAAARHRGPRRSRGFGLLQVLLMIAVMAGLAAMGYLQWRERSAVNVSRQERQALSQADRALIAYATVAQRLPCPDTDRDGLENCGSGNQSGWLPSVTLRLAGSDAGVDVGQLRYLVQREGGANDLTVLDDSWRPLTYDDEDLTYDAMRTTGDGEYPAGILTLTDLCLRLETGRLTPLTGTMAQVNSTTRRSTAYALAHPGNGDADGDGNLFDGANTGVSANEMEAPEHRPLLATYNDQVLERSHTSLLSAFHCRPLIDSINTVALAHDVTLGVAGMRADNIESARRAVAFAALAAAMTSLEIVLAVLEGTSDAGNAAFEWAICAASLGLAANACAAAPQHTVAIGLAGGVIAANTAAVALNVVAAVMAGHALALADSSVDASDLQCPAMDPQLQTIMLRAAEQAVNDAVARQEGLATEIAAKQQNLIDANDHRAQVIAAVINAFKIGVNEADNANVQRLAALQNATDAWAVASFNLEVAESRVEQATRERNLWADEVHKYELMLQDIDGTIERLNLEIAALDAQINATPEPFNKTDLENERTGKNAELQLAQNPEGLKAALGEAIVSRDAAQDALNIATDARSAAQADLNAKQQAYQAAHSDFRANACPACELGDNSSFSLLVSQLFGGHITPNTDAVYLKPVKIQNEIAAYQRALAEAQEAETKARAQQAQIQETVNNPGACNISGTAVVPMTPAQAEAILVEVDRKGGTR